MINLFNPKQTNKLGVISYVEINTNIKNEVNIYDIFWKNNYEPSVNEIITYLLKKGHNNIKANIVNFYRVM